MNKAKRILIFALFIIAWASSLLYVINYYQFKLDRFEMYYVERFNETHTMGIPDGLYFSQGFTCIYLKDREYADVLETFNHEWAHYTSGFPHYMKT